MKFVSKSPNADCKDPAYSTVRTMVLRGDVVSWGMWTKEIPLRVLESVWEAIWEIMLL